MPPLTPTPPAPRPSRQFALFATVVLGFLLAVGVTFYVRGRTLMEAQLKTRLRDTAAVAAQQFDPEILRGIRGPEALTSPTFAQVVARLRAIRVTIPSIHYAYLMRRTADASALEFVADADSLLPTSALDRNGDGIVQADEEASYPGDLYDISEIPALQGAAFENPTVDPEVTRDQWGSLISGYAPVRDAEGRVVAVLGVDMDAAEYERLSTQIFSPVGLLLGIVAGLAFLGYVLLYLRNRRMETVQRVEQERSSVLMLTSHQLGTPLTIFEWSLESMRDSLAQGKLAEEFEESARNMEVGIERLRGVLGNLRDADRYETGAFAYQPEWAYLRNVIVEVVHGAASELRKKGQRVEQDLDGNIHLRLDRAVIGGVVRELLQNAMTFSPEHAVITVTARRHRDTAVVTVKDTGCGIPAYDLPRLFGKFVRGSNAHIARPDGNGLGLFIAKAAVEKAGGRIRVESAEGEGTVVTFTLPLDPSS